MGNTSYPNALSLRNTALAACPGSRETPATPMFLPRRKAATDAGIVTTATSDAYHASEVPDTGGSESHRYVAALLASRKKECGIFGNRSAKSRRLTSHGHRGKIP